MKGSKATLLQRACAWLILLLLVTGAIYGAGRLVWWAASQVPPDAARMWAMLATALLPLTAWAGWYFGHTESRGVLSGIDKAADKMFGLMTQTLSARVGTAKALQQAAPQANAVMEMPRAELPPVHFPELVDGVIDI